MKTIDFSKPGGFPLTQDRLSYLQTAYSEIIGALGSAPGLGGPVKLAGMEYTSGGISALDHYADGWLYYNNEVIRFAAGTASAALIVGTDLFITIGQTSAPLTYYDATTNNVVNEKVATIHILPNTTPVDATCFKYRDLKSFGQAIGVSYREQTWQHITVVTASGSGSMLGDIYYKKDTTANTLQLRGSIGTFTPSDFNAWPNVSSVLMGTLNGNYRPANEVYFTVQVEAGTAMIKDANGTYFSRLNAVLKTDGKIYIDWILPQAGVFSYSMCFNLVLPLD